MKATAGDAGIYHHAHTRETQPGSFEQGWASVSIKSMGRQSGELNCPTLFDRYSYRHIFRHQKIPQRLHARSKINNESSRINQNHGLQNKVQFLQTNSTHLTYFIYLPLYNENRRSSNGCQLKKTAT